MPRLAAVFHGLLWVFTDPTCRFENMVRRLKPVEVRTSIGIRTRGKAKLLMFLKPQSYAGLHGVYSTECDRCFRVTGISISVPHSELSIFSYPDLIWK